MSISSDLACLDPCVGDTTPPSGDLSDDEWEWACERLPIACVDVLPVRRDGFGYVTQVGLIRRDFVGRGERWCHVGGRVLIEESLTEAAERHLFEALVSSAAVTVPGEPYMVNQYFRTVRAGMGYDPRKHAVATCFLVEFPSSAKVSHQGREATDFRWFPLNSIPDNGQLWPGTTNMINRPEVVGPRDELAVYQAVSDRYVSHNQLLWQTPVLAMTAMAFLLTIALSTSSRPWERAIAGMLSAGIAIISSQLMAKHSASERSDAVLLEGIERRRGMPVAHAYYPPVNPGFPRRPGDLNRWFVGQRSRIWWFNSLLTLAAVSIGIAVQAVVIAIGS